MAPPMAIMPSCPEPSWRESCSPFSMPPGADSVVLISGAGASGGVKNAEQADGFGSVILEAVDHAVRQVDARARSKLRGGRLPFQVQNALALQDVDALFVRVVVEWRTAGRNPAHELRHPATTHVGMNQKAELTVRARANAFAVILMNHHPRGADTRVCSVDTRVDVVGHPRQCLETCLTPWILGATGAHDSQSLLSRIFDLADLPGRHEHRRAGTEGITVAADSALTL